MKLSYKQKLVATCATGVLIIAATIGVGTWRYSKKYDSSFAPAKQSLTDKREWAKQKLLEIDDEFALCLKKNTDPCAVAQTTNDAGEVVPLPTRRVNENDLVCVTNAVKAKTAVKAEISEEKRAFEKIGRETTNFSLILLGILVAEAIATLMAVFCIIPNEPTKHRPARCKEQAELRGVVS